MRSLVRSTFVLALAATGCGRIQPGDTSDDAALPDDAMDAAPDADASDGSYAFACSYSLRAVCCDQPARPACFDELAQACEIPGGGAASFTDPADCNGWAILDLGAYLLYVYRGGHLVARLYPNAPPGPRVSCVVGPASLDLPLDCLLAAPQRPCAGYDSGAGPLILYCDAIDAGVFDAGPPDVTTHP